MKKSQERLGHVPARRRYFSAIYRKHDVHDPSTTKTPVGSTGIYAAIQKLSQRHLALSKPTPFVTLWPFRLKKVLGSNPGKFKLLRYQSFLEKRSLKRHTDWHEVIPSEEERNSCRRAFGVLKKARKELIDHLTTAHPRLKLIAWSASGKVYGHDDLSSNAIRSKWITITETGTLPWTCLKGRDQHDSKKDGKLLYLAVSEESLATLLKHLSGEQTRHRTIDTTTSEWLQQHLVALYKELERRYPSSGGKPAYPPTFDECFNFAKLIGNLWPISFAPNAFRENVWKELKLPRSSGAKLTKEKKGFLSGLFAKYEKQLRSDKQRPAADVLAAIFQAQDGEADRQSSATQKPSGQTLGEP